jgi:hypothetical protein
LRTHANSAEVRLRGWRTLWATVRRVVVARVGATDAQDGGAARNCR